MRRNEFDEQTQLRRNLACNPVFAATSGNQTIRTNLLTNPRTEYTTGLTNSVVRTNLCTDPLGVNGTFPVYGTGQTLAGNVAITGHPEGLTTATRVTYDATSTNPGITIYNGTVAGQTYTMSAWVFHETIAATPGSQGFAQAGVLSMPSPPAIVAGVWQKLTWQHSPSNANPYGFRVSSNNGAGSYLITGIHFEQTKAAAPSYFDGVNHAALRLNLTPNSTAVLGNAWFLATTSTATFTTNNAGGPLGTPFARTKITTPGTGLNYFAVAHGSTTPAQWTPAAPGRTYIISAYIRATMVNYQQPGIRLRWKDAAGTTIKDEPIVYATGTTSGQWVRLSSSGVAPAGTRYIELMGGFVSIDQATLTANDTVDMSAALTEEGSTLGAYFDGNTATAGGVTCGFRGTANAVISFARDSELVASWAGAANASTPRLLGPSIEGWAQATTAGVYRTSTQGSPIPGGTYTAAVVTAGFNGDGIYFNDVTVVAGTSYTASAWIKITDVIPTMSSVMRFKDAGGTILQDLGGTVHTSLVIGQWVRVSTTAVAPATATKLQQMWRLYSSSYTPSTFYVTGALLEATPVLGPYFDGTTAAAGDYTYAWSAAADRSTALQRAISIPQIVASKSSSVLDAKFFGFQSTAEDGQKTLKYLSPMGTASSSWRVAQIAGGGNPQGWDYARVKLGARYTFFMRYRSSGWGAGQTFNMQIADGNNGNTVIGNTPALPLNAIGWVDYRRTFTAVRDANFASQIYMALPVLPQTGTDGIFELQEWALYEGDYQGDYIDGSKPLAKWEGTANAATSIGYPPQLQDIAGKPILDYSAPGTYLLDDSFGATEARSFYTVFETLSEIPNGGAVSPIIQYGDLALNDTVPNTYVQLRQDSNSTTPNGTNNLFLRRYGAAGVGYPATVSRHVAAWGVNTSGYLFMGADGNTRVTDSQIMAMPHQKLVVVTPQTAGTHIRTIAYRGLHDAATATAISRYLGNKYGANVA